MDNPKFIFDLIEKVSSLSLSTSSYFYIILATFISSLIGGYLSGVFKEQAKIDTITRNFETLKNQLSENTEATKRIETAFNEKLWISQQVWQKKYEVYESIFDALAKIKSWTDHEIGIIELHLIPNYIASNYQPYFSKEEEIQFYKEIQEANDNLHDVLENPEHKEVSKAKAILLEKGIDSLSEILILKSFILNPKVSEELRKLPHKLKDFPGEFEELDAYQSRLSTAIHDALKSLRLLAQEELKL